MVPDPRARTERRPKRNGIACKACGCEDLWRVASKRGFITWLLERGGKKRFACRYCGCITYRLVRRGGDIVESEKYVDVKPLS